MGRHHMGRGGRAEGVGEPQKGVPLAYQEENFGLWTSLFLVFVKEKAF